MRLHDLGRPGEGQLSRLRLDHVQEGGPGAKKPFCINEACSNFTPEEKRGGWRKKTEESGEEAPAQEAAEEGKTAEKKAPAAKRPPRRRRPRSLPPKPRPQKGIRGEKAHG